jgi:hypothetical protein
VCAEPVEGSPCFFGRAGPAGEGKHKKCLSQEPLEIRQALVRRAVAVAMG